MGSSFLLFPPHRSHNTGSNLLNKKVAGCFWTSGWILHETNCKCSIIKLPLIVCELKVCTPPTHPLPLSSCLSLLVINELCKVSMNTVSCEPKILKPVKYPAEECLTINPFISILNINEFPQGSFALSLPLICLSSPFLSLLLNHSQALNPQFYSGTVRDTSQTFKCSECVCDICVFATFLKCKCAYKTWKPQKPICCTSLCSGLFLESGTSI